MDLYLKRSRTPRIALPAMMEEADENTEILIRFETTPEERERVKQFRILGFLSSLRLFMVNKS
jgi:hypothetical protein